MTETDLLILAAELDRADHDARAYALSAEADQDAREYVRRWASDRHVVQSTDEQSN